ncbi:MAG: hypothetical protein NTV77_02200 [Candidatus Azambacteria bacterium]|nr:hypothetical protein [Candidatus Azambacteria bacterium]
MGENNSEKYLPLKTAAQLYGYTRDHLGLVIRQNKLKGIKLGSYYVTTNEWMTDYIKNFADLKHPTFKRKLSNKFLTEILSSKNGGELVVNDKNIVRKTAKMAVLKNTQNNTIKKYTVDNNLREKILKELEQYKSLTDSEALKTGINQIESAVLTFSNAPYVILPIRKMNDFERDEILNRIRQENNKDDASDFT